MSVDSPKLLIPAEALTPQDVDAYHALRTSAVCWESHGHWSTFRGDKAADALNGLVTNDVSKLAVGDGLYAAALTPKGKMIADMLIIRLEATAFAISVARTAAPAWLELARKYVNPRLAKVADEADRFRTWMVYGAHAPEAIAAMGGGTATAENFTEGMVSVLSEWPTWRHAPWNVGLASVRLIRAPLMGTRAGFILMAESSEEAVVQKRLDSAPLVKGSRALWNLSRVEAGRPAMGIDMDENTIPQEANLDTLGAISFEKGCYTGQETVARIHFRGHVNRRLRGLLGDAPMSQGAEVTDASGKVVGDVRSSVISPALGPIAMTMLRREVVDGDLVTVAGAGDEDPITARVIELPFPAE